MEFVGKAGESGGGMFVVSILFHFEDVLVSIHASSGPSARLVTEHG